MTITVLWDDEEKRKRSSSSKNHWKYPKLLNFDRIWVSDFLDIQKFGLNKTEKPFSLQDDKKINMADKNRFPNFIFDIP